MLGVDESLGGEGTPAVSAFAPEPVAATLGISTASGMRLIADALDLQHRLPRIWRLVETLQVEPWQARQVAQATHPLSQEAAAYVDERLAPVLPSCGFGAIQTAVAMAIAKYHPELLDQKQKSGRAGWHVTLTHPKPGDYAGTSYLDVAGDTLDLTAFHDLVCDQAAQLDALGDTDDLEVRKAKALGVIASQQATLDLLTLTAESSLGGTESSVVEPVETTKPRKPKTRLYLHLTLAELLHLDGGEAVGSVEKLGPATLTKIKEWVGHSQVTIRPVLDLATTDRGRRARPAGLDARARHPPRRPLHLPLVRGRRPRAATTTTSTPTSRWTKAGHRARRIRRISPRSAGDTTGARPPDAGATEDETTAPTSGTDPTAGPTSSPRTAPCNSPSTDRSRPDHPAPTGRSGLPCRPDLCRPLWERTAPARSRKQPHPGAPLP